MLSGIPGNIGFNFFKKMFNDSFYHANFVFSYKILHHIIENFRIDQILSKEKNELIL